MSAPVFVVPVDALASAVAGDVVLVEGAEGRHAVAVQRLREGEQVDLVDGAGRRVRGHVQAQDGRDCLHVAIGDVIDEPSSQPRLIVVQALAKGESGELAVDQLTQVGVDEIVPWAAAHCVVQWKGDRADRSAQRWRDAITAAGKQSRRAQFPHLAPLASTREVVDLLAKAALGVVLHEQGAEGLAEISVPARGDVVLIVGPEGGLSEAELIAFQGAGARIARLGSSVLRASAAGIAGAAVVLSGTARWRIGPPGPNAVEG